MKLTSRTAGYNIIKGGKVYTHLTLVSVSSRRAPGRGAKAKLELVVNRK